MDTTLRHSDSLDGWTEPARGTSASSFILGVLTFVFALPAVALVGAVVLRLAGDGMQVHTSVAFTVALAGVVALLVVVGIPLAVGLRYRSNMRRHDPLVRRRSVWWLLPWSLFVLAAVPLLAPDLTRVSLETKGAWMVGWTAPSVRGAVDRFADRVAARIPLHTPLALTHRTVWPWVDRDSPACRGAVSTR